MPGRKSGKSGGRASANKNRVEGGALAVHIRPMEALFAARGLMSIKSAAARCGVSQSTMHKLFHGGMPRLDLAVLERVCEVLGCTVNELIRHDKGFLYRVQNWCEAVQMTVGVRARKRMVSDGETRDLVDQNDVVAMGYVVAAIEDLNPGHEGGRAKFETHVIANPPRVRAEWDSKDTTERDAVVAQLERDVVRQSEELVGIAGGKDRLRNRLTVLVGTPYSNRLWEPLIKRVGADLGIESGERPVMWQGQKWPQDELMIRDMPEDHGIYYEGPKTEGRKIRGDAAIAICADPMILAVFGQKASATLGAAKYLRDKGIAYVAEQLRYGLNGVNAVLMVMDEAEGKMTVNERELNWGLNILEAPARASAERGSGSK